MSQMVALWHIMMPKRNQNMLGDKLLLILRMSMDLLRTSHAKQILFPSLTN